jgi:hypothetical protein
MFYVITVDCLAMGSADNRYCLRWNDYRANISYAFQDLRSSADFFDVTLATEESEIRAHRVILSACSPHLREVLKRHSSVNQQNLLIYLRGVRHNDLEVTIGVPTSVAGAILLKKLVATLPNF